MPKVVGTRKLKAVELLKTIKKGPDLSVEAFGIKGVPLNPEQRRLVNEYFKNHYRMWSQTWIVDQTVELIPELKGKVND